MSNLYVFESADSESVVICERGPDGELPFASVFPGVPMAVPPRAEVRALARARAERIIEVLAWGATAETDPGRAIGRGARDRTRPAAVSAAALLALRDGQ